MYEIFFLASIGFNHNDQNKKFDKGVQKIENCFSILWSDDHLNVPLKKLI